MAHVIDISPTLLDLAGLSVDQTADGPSLPGRSLKPAFEQHDAVVHEDLWFYHEGNRALRQGNWKIIHSLAARPFPWNSSSAAANEHLNPAEWALYDLELDRAEQHDLAQKYPERVAAMSARWEEMRVEFLRQATP
jgi:arylsulfatase